jgi:hypothetical protein
LALKGDELDAFIYEMRFKWTFKELGNVKYFLDIHIIRNKEYSKLYLYQDAYIDKILDRYGMDNNKPIDILMAFGTFELMIPFNNITLKKDIKEYGSIISSLNYLAC